MEQKERETGIEPASLGWKPSALPLCYSRKRSRINITPRIVVQPFMAIDAQHITFGYLAQNVLNTPLIMHRLRN